MLERDVEKYLVERVKAVGGKVRKVKWVGRKGAPDRLVFGRRLRPCFVELKRPEGGVLSQHQKDEIADLIEGGFDVFVVNTMDGVDALMRWAVSR